MPRRYVDGYRQVSAWIREDHFFDLEEMARNWRCTKVQAIERLIELKMAETEDDHAG